MKKENSLYAKDLVEQEPQITLNVFGERTELIRSFVDNLVQFGEVLGLIGPLEIPRLWTRHIINSALLAPLLAPGDVGDVGSGAGFPGLVLAIARPDVNFVLIEPMEKRVKWLQNQANDLNLSNVEVVRTRAEDFSNKSALDQITARAVSSFAKLIPLCFPLLKPGGEFLFLKGNGAEDEIFAADRIIRKHRLSHVEIIELGSEMPTEKTRLIRAKKPLN